MLYFDNLSIKIFIPVFMEQFLVLMWSSFIDFAVHSF